jgi:hypothetical protein
MLAEAMHAHPLVSVVLLAVMVPAVCVAVGLSFAKLIGWATTTPKRGALLAGIAGGGYVLLAVATAFPGGSSLQTLTFVGLAIVWGAMAWWRYLGPGSHRPRERL